MTSSLDWNDLRYLLAIARHGSLSGASQQLKVTKATVSRRVAALENALERPLLIRRPTGMQLTEAGQRAIDAAKTMECASQRLTDKTAG